MSNLSPKTNNQNGQANLAAGHSVINAEKIKHMAHLSRIGISQLEAEKYAAQMESILAYMKILEEVDTEGVEMTLQVTGLKNVLRADQVEKMVSPEELLQVSPLPKIGGQIAVKAVIKED